MKDFFVITLLISLTSVWQIINANDATSLSDGKTTGVRYTPDYLLSLGQTLKSPLMKLLGLVTLCNGQKICEKWSEWGRCSVDRQGNFGIRNRTRVCGHHDHRCGLSDTEEVVSEQSLCEGFCPINYNLTKHGFCLRYINEGVVYATAFSRCKQDGGYLLNINSAQKLVDLKETYKLRNNIMVDGKRETLKNPWIFTYGDNPEELNWGHSEPHDRNVEFCMAFTPMWRRIDVSCSNVYDFICEIVPGP